MSTRKRLSSSSSFSSNCSYSSYYGGVGEKNEGDGEDGKFQKSLTLFDDVKIILCRHDKKLSQLEDDMNFMVEWLHKKFGFMLRNGSSSSILSDCEDDLELETEDKVATDMSDEEPSSKSKEYNIRNGVGRDEDGMRKIEEPNNSVIVDLEKTTDNAMDILEILETEDEESSRDEAYSPRPNIHDMVDTIAVIKPPSPPVSVPVPVSTPKKRTRGPSKRKSQASVNNDEYQLPSQCDICGKFLKDPSSLRQHKQIHLNIRPFVCPEPECGKSFRRKFHMQTHLLIHKGDKKHQCNYCGRLFLLQKDLVSHERIHTGERPFQCSDCSKSFILKSHLVMHLRTHTGEKPYICEICSKCFTQSNSLRLHKKKLHPENAASKQSKPSKKKSNSTRKTKKGTRKSQMNKTSAIPGHSRQLTLSTPQLPAKLPIYKNQGITSFSKSAPTITVLQPMTSSQSYEILEHHILSEDQVIIPQSTFQLLPNTSIPMQMITSNILDISNSDYHI
ncbi:unnamed protein product [Orchesella dallaii]|uniref:C2H2-type domain-containing protein n=1 Tax=Orchesella dallaii TaxID=48710 RepID=A0ABP1RCA1_9HEXA